jgi:general secretion pathway protein A
MSTTTAQGGDIRSFYGFKALPFSTDVGHKQAYKLVGMLEIADGINFALQTGMYYTIIGDVGSGKSTALRYACAQLPAKSYHVLSIVGGAWSFSELLRQVSAALGKPVGTSQQTSILRGIEEALHAVRSDGRLPVLVVDEAHLFNLSVYAQLHLIGSGGQSGPSMPVVLCGQESLFDKMQAPECRPLMSRMLTGYNLRSLSQDEAGGYIEHHVHVIGGVSREVFTETARIAIGQASAGIMRKVNALCLLALRTGMELGSQSIDTEIVRRISRNWWE